MRIGFVGAGRVGVTLGKYFKDHGANIAGYFSRNPDSAKEASDFTGTNYYDSIRLILSESDALFLTIPDTAIESVWDVLKELPVDNKIICHCSGSISSCVFDGIEDRMAFGYSIHPFFAVSLKYKSYEAINQAFFTLEGSEKYLQDMKHFIEQMGNRVHIISQSQKIKYHTAAVFLSNLVTALAHTGCKMLRDCGFGDEMISTALKTLFLSHCVNIAENGIVKTLTGPIERNDMITVKNNLDCISGNGKKLYGYLSTQLIEVAKEKHNDYDYSAIGLMIKEEMEKCDRDYDNNV